MPDPNPMNWWTDAESAQKRLESFEAQLLLRTLMDRHGLRDWYCEFVGGLFADTAEARHLGLCNLTERRIVITRACVERTVAQVKDTILHEIAHALTNEPNHTDKWAEKAWELGVSSAEIIRTVDDEVAHASKDDAKESEQGGICCW